MDIPFLKQALLNPEIYPDHPKKVGFFETHISLLFLTGNHVYKVKKPVDFGFLGVVKITKDDDRILLDGRGEVVEYAVKMKQIPEEFLMDKLLKKGQVTPIMIEAVSERLARFYSTAETSDVIKSFAKPERIKQDTDENFEQTEKYIDLTIGKDVYSEIRDRTNQFLRTQAEIFYRRIAEDRIRDCHGDLRLEHIFWGDEISIFDCIEFNERFRYTDVAADIAFLAMDLDYHGREDLSEHLIQTYVEKSGDRDLAKLPDFYKCYRAYVRGKVESFRLDDPNIPENEKKAALQRAKKYFDLAQRYAGRMG